MYVGDDVSLGDYDGDGDDGLGACCEECAGLSGMGLTLPPSSTSQDCVGLPILDFIKCEAEKLTSGIMQPTTPVYTPPYFPTYPVNTGTPAAPASTMFSQPSNWLPWALGGLAVLALSKRRRR